MQPKLKRLRVIFGVLNLALFTFIFIDFADISPRWLIQTLTYLQVTPSLLKFLNVVSLASAGFLIIFLSALIFGRVYCSVLCPLGIFQDLISRISLKFKKRKIFRYSKPHNILRFTLLGLVVIFLLAGNVFLLNLLDPYSNFGKIFSDLARPGLASANDILSKLLQKINIFSLFPAELHHVHWGTLIYPLLFLTVVVIMSAFRGRFFCNTLCPVGSTLGILSKVSLFKIQINEQVCTKCGKCSAACKSECIDIKSKKSDFTRCVGCFNCINSCPEEGIRYRFAFSSEKKNGISEKKGRKEFFGKLAVSLAGLALFSPSTSASENKKKDRSIIPNKKNFPVTPPGSLSLENFTKRCTACHLCVSVCMAQVLKPALFEYGVKGIMQPHMDYNESFCNYDCTKCSKVCPTGAIMEISPERKKTTQIGVVRFIKENCVVLLDGTSCGACSEHCPTKAVQMVPYKGMLTIPETNSEICIGCGACEFACPARPDKAIFVDGCKVHQVAKKPEIKKTKEEVIKDFPF